MKLVTSNQSNASLDLTLTQRFLAISLHLVDVCVPYRYLHVPVVHYLTKVSDEMPKKLSQVAGMGASNSNVSKLPNFMRSSKMTR